MLLLKTILYFSTVEILKLALSQRGEVCPKHDPVTPAEFIVCFLVLKRVELPACNCSLPSSAVYRYERKRWLAGCGIHKQVW